MLLPADQFPFNRKRLLPELRNKGIFDMSTRCDTEEEIAEGAGIPRITVEDISMKIVELPVSSGLSSIEKGLFNALGVVRTYVSTSDGSS
jgi:hypothetical protein